MSDEIKSGCAVRAAIQAEVGTTVTEATHTYGAFGEVDATNYLGPIEHGLRDVHTSNPIFHTIDLGIRQFTEISVKRAERWHQGDINSWSLSDWFTAMAGEVGEVGNVIKKLNRSRDGLAGNNKTDAQLEAQLEEELGDVIAYWVLLCRRAGINPVRAIVMKFNEVSRRNGWPDMLL